MILYLLCQYTAADVLQYIDLLRHIGLVRVGKCLKEFITVITPKIIIISLMYTRSNKQVILFGIGYRISGV